MYNRKRHYPEMYYREITQLPLSTPLSERYYPEMYYKKIQLDSLNSLKLTLKYPQNIL